MSKGIILILSLYFLIATAYCGDLQYCQSKFSYNYDKPATEETANEDKNTLIKFEDGSDRDVWHHADSCNSLSTGTERVCCYIHIEYKSEVTGERYDKYGCIDVDQPYEDYGGNISNVDKRVDQVENNLKNLTAKGGNVTVVDEDSLHVKIVCSTKFLKVSLFALLLLILF